MFNQTTKEACEFNNSESNYSYFGDWSFPYFRKMVLMVFKKYIVPEQQKELKITP